MIKLKKLIKESKKKDYGFKSDVKKFRQEYTTHQGKFKQKALGLHETQQIMKAVGMVNEKIMEMISELNKKLDKEISVNEHFQCSVKIRNRQKIICWSTVIL